MKRIVTVLIIALLAAFFTPISYAADGKQIAVPLGNSEAPYGYYEYLPLGYSEQPSKNWPVVIFLHGSGEKGNGTTQLNLVLKNGPPKNINNGTQYPFICISPQSSVWWNVGNIDKMIEFVKSNYRVDTSRIYLTGISMGGGGTWSYATNHPDKLAAIVPICGAAAPSNASKLVDLPVWAFHSWGDTTVSSSNSVGWCNSIAGAIAGTSPTNMIANYPGTYTGLPGKSYKSDKTRTANFNPETGWTWLDGSVRIFESHPTLTLYPDTSHDSWTRTYNDQKMWEWLLSQRKTPKVIDNDGLATIITPYASGAAQGSKYFPMEDAFDSQSAFDEASGQPIGGTVGKDAPYYSNRYGYIDFGPEWNKIRITSTWTKYRIWSVGDQTPYAELWWDDDIDMLNDSGLVESNINFNTGKGLNTKAQEMWVKDFQSTNEPVIPRGRYLICHSASNMSNRAKEYAIVGYIETIIRSSVPSQAP